MTFLYRASVACCKHVQGVQKKMSRSVCLISPATSILEDFVSSTSSFLCDVREPRYEENKMGYQISRIRNTVLLQCWQKTHAPTQKAYFWSQKKVFYIIYFFSCLKMVFCELMLLELGDLLGLSLLRNCFSVGRSLFSCKYFSKIAQYFEFF